MKKYVFVNKQTFVLSTLIVALLFFLIVAAYTLHPNRYITCAGNLLTVEKTHLENGEAVIEKIKIPKGTKVKVHQKQEHSSIIIYNHDKLKVKNSNLSNSFNEAIHTDYVYCRRLVNLREEKGGKLSKVVVKKGERVKVESIDKKDWDENTGQIRWYKVKKKNKTYYLSGTYVESSRKLALKKYDQAISYSTYWDDYYKNGYSKDAYTSQIDYKPIKKETYNENPSLAINNAMISKKDLTKIIKEYKKKGFYCVSRIVTFKDAVFAMENPKESLTDKSGNLVMYNDQYWPSAYSRKAWMYNVELAKECADLGFNEIQFDYVRFPDGTASANSKLNFHNTYKESKVAAIQGFLEYAKEELSPKHVYVAADMFAWPIVACDDQDIGQFLPAIANVVDIICPMPYLDHFSSGSFDIENPVENPYDTLYAFTKISNEQLKSIKYPAKYRTWIQGYNIDADGVKQEIKALKDTNYPDYMVWLASGDKKDIDKIKKGF